VQLKDETNLVPQQAQGDLPPAKLRTIHKHAAAVGLVQPPEQMQQGALTASRRSAKGHGLALDDLEVHAI
jgi:hypothetical protein